MLPGSRMVAVRYGFAVIAVIAALVVRLLLDPLVGDRLPFLFFSVAVIAVAWHCGFGPSLLTLVAGLLTGAFFFIRPRYALADSLAAQPILAFGFLFLGTVIALFSERLRTARQRAEVHASEAVRQRNELAQEVMRRGQLEKELQDRNAALAEADRRKDEFLAMLSHELRNPLAPIRNATHIMRLLMGQDAKLEWATDVIDRQVTQMSRLVDDLLEVSRISHGKITLKKERIDLRETVEHAVESSRPLLETRKHQLVLALPAEPVWCDADPVRMGQVVANLLSNAAKYTTEGGRICLKLEHRRDGVTLRVLDNGMGIASEMLQRVFDPFAQADHTLGRSDGGLGIGLTLVKSLVELHNGRVEALSAGRGRGSEFVVYLPTAASPAPAAAEETRQRAAAPSNARRVLAVDDNVDSVESLAQLLRLQGHDVRTAYDGPTGLATAEAFSPEVVLLDIGLPHMDGYEVARRLREDLGTRKALLIAVTGYGLDDDRRRAHEAGFDAHLVKPAESTILQSLLASPQP